MESFEIENPSQKRISNFCDDNDISTNNAHPNDISLVKNEENEVKIKKSYLRFKGDNEFFGVVNLLASAIGSGCVTFPSLLQTAGVVTSLLIFTIVSISIYFSLYLLTSFIIKTNLYSLAEITQKLLGNKWLKIYAFSSVLFYLSGEVNYTNLIVEYGAKGLFKINDTYLMIIFYLSICIIEIILCLFISNMSHIHILSLISVLCFTFIVVALIVYTIMIIDDETKLKFSLDKLFMPPSDSILEYIISIFTCFIEYVYSYVCHSSFPTLIGNLKTKDDKTKQVVNIYFTIILIMYFLISIFGYISQINSEEKHKTLILFTNDSLQGIFNYILQIAITLFFVCLIPIRFLVLRDNYKSLFTCNITYTIDLIFISLNIILTNVISYFCHSDSNIIFSLNEIFGGIFGVGICFVLPVITYISINKKGECKSVLGYIMAIFFLLIGLFTAGYSFSKKIIKII